MCRKVGLAAAMTLVVVLSAGLAGGQVGAGGANTAGFLRWGNHEPIYIYGDDDFTAENGVVSGHGTPDDPYVIEGWQIDTSRADYGIYVDHTRKHFVIRDCIIERARIAGVYLNSVRNGAVRDTQIGLSDVAVYLLNSDGNTIRSSVIADCHYGIVMAADSDRNTISGNSFLNNGLNAKDAMRENSWCEEGRGNYWSDFEGCDANGDGVYDAPNYRYGDPCPLVAPPVEWTGVIAAGLSFSGNWVAPDGSLVVTSQTPISLVAADPATGVAEIRYAVDGGAWTVYTVPIYLIGEDGPRKVEYYGVDHLGNAEPEETVSFILDNHPPTTVLEVGEPVYVDERGTWVTSKTPITLRRTQESTYGKTLTYFRIDSLGWHVYYEPFVLHAADGPHQIFYYSRNASGVAEDLRTDVLIKGDASLSTRGQRPGSSPIDVIVGPPEETPPAVVQPEPGPEPEPLPEPEPALPPEPQPDVVPDVQTPSEIDDGDGGAIQNVQTPSEPTG